MYLFYVLLVTALKNADNFELKATKLNRKV